MSLVCSLPEELRNYIFSYCDDADIGRIAQVCQLWRATVADVASRRALAIYGVRDLGDPFPALHPRWIRWQPAKAADGAPLAPLAFSQTRGYDLKPGIFQGKPVLTGQPEGRDGIVVIDSETFEELAALDDDRFTARGWYQDEEGTDLLLMHTADGQPYAWNPDTDEVTELAGIERCEFVNCPVLWKGEPSLLYRTQDGDYCVRPLQGGTITTLISSSRGRLYLESPHRDRVLVWEQRGRYRHLIHCWDAKTGERKPHIDLFAEIEDLTVVGKGEHARLVIISRISTGDLMTDVHLMEFPLYTYSLETGERIQVVDDYIPREGGFAVTTDGETSYLHAFGRQHEGGLFHKCWHFVDGRARALETGPLDSDAELAQLPHGTGRTVFEAFHGSHRFFLPTTEGLAPVDPVLRVPEPSDSSDPISSSSSSSSTSLHSKSEPSKSSSSRKSLLLVAALIGTCAVGIVVGTTGWRLTRSLLRT